jgi:hypothetical protein
MSSRRGRHIHEIPFEMTGIPTSLLDSCYEELRQIGCIRQVGEHVYVWDYPHAEPALTSLYQSEHTVH